MLMSTVFIVVDMMMLLTKRKNYPVYIFGKNKSSSVNLRKRLRMNMDG